MVLDRYYDIYLIKTASGNFAVTHKGGGTIVPTQFRANAIFDRLKAKRHATK